MKRKRVRVMVGLVLDYAFDTMKEFAEMVKDLP